MLVRVLTFSPSQELNISLNHKMLLHLCMIPEYPFWPFQNQLAEHDLHCLSRYFLALNRGKLYYFYEALSEPR